MITEIKTIIQSHLKQILSVLGLFILLYVLYNANLLENLSVFSSINLFFLAIAFLFSLLNIVLKVYRWKYLSANYGKNLTMYDASLVTISSFFYANITPGKIGDLFKAYYMNKKHQLRYISGISMLFYERFFELVILLIVAFSVVLFLEIDSNTLLVLAVTFILLLGLVVFYLKSDFILEKIERFADRYVAKYTPGEEKLRLEKLPSVKIMAIFVITFFSLVMEFVRLWFVALSFGFTVDFFMLSSFFCISILFGLISQIPLGIGITEGSLIFFIEKLGVPSPVASAIVIVDRIISMYFSLIIGYVFSKLALDSVEEFSI